MKTVTELHTMNVALYCPHCGEEQGGFCVNPAGGEFECDDCHKPYKVHSEADIEHR
ncbi:hypothetical protein OH460_24255 [Vibrio sp. Makdt]|uniref:hypothetical protein n=1 Tax=Vibrio sp. Makdt TaxID=2998828 RepID=UPI0022CD36FD|nr:hypothetical protein [Vibrio sp. Makdt]MDA0155436.1 hypothetical protein [Vibrio sp. Makdt]